MSELSVLAVHGVGAGEGAVRKGFSKELKRLVFSDATEADRRWHECVWEDLNDVIYVFLISKMSIIYWSFRFLLM